MFNFKTVATAILLCIPFNTHAIQLDQLKYVKTHTTKTESNVYQLKPKCFVNSNYQKESKSEKEMLRDQRIICVTIHSFERDQHAN